MSQSPRTYHINSTWVRRTGGKAVTICSAYPPATDPRPALTVIPWVTRNHQSLHNQWENPPHRERIEIEVLDKYYVSESEYLKHVESLIAANPAPIS